MSADAPRVLIVNPKAANADALRDALSAAGAQPIVETTCDASLAARIAPDVVVIDVDGCERDVVGLTAAFAGAVPTSAIVLLSADPDERVVEDALMAGAVGMLRRDLPVPALLRAIHGAAAGEVLVPRGMQPRLLEQLRALEDDSA